MALTPKETILLSTLNYAREQLAYKRAKPNITVDSGVTFDGYYDYYLDKMGVQLIHLFTFANVPCQSLPFFTFLRIQGGISAIEMPYIYGKIPLNATPITQQYDFDEGIRDIVKTLKGNKNIPLIMKCGNDVFHDVHILDIQNDYMVIEHIHAEADNPQWGYIKKCFDISFLIFLGIPLHRLAEAHIEKYLPKGAKEYHNKYIKQFNGVELSV